jgi:hypothetical protein
MTASWEILDTATQARKKLLHAGFMPIPTVGKAPSMPGWQDITATETDIEGWFHSQEEAFNTGVLTKHAPAVDIDVYDPEVAAEIEELLWDMIGTRSMVRFGQPPKRAVLFRTDAPFRKIATPVFTSPLRQQHRVEVLCDGQQIVVLGTHPGTGQPYRWHGGEPGTVALADLPLMTEALAREFIDKAAALMRGHGWTEEVRRTNGAHRGATYGNGGDDFDAIYGSREQKYAAVALSGCCDELAAMAPNSGRNDKLNALAFRLGRMCTRQWIERDRVSARLYEAAAACLLVNDDGEAATRATINSGLGKGEQEPHPDLGEAKQESDSSAGEPPHGYPLEYYETFGAVVTKAWIIKGVIAKGETSSWIGPPGAGKSALIADLAIHAAAGTDWRGYRSKQPCAVVYFALERGDLVKRRLVAQAKRTDDNPDKRPLALVRQIVDLLRPACVGEVIATIRAAEAHYGCEVGMIVIDTYAKSIAANGGDENSAKDQNMTLANLRRIQEATGAHVALVGHTGKDETRGARGSNAHLADVDLTVQFSGDKDTRSATIIKNNDGPEGVLTCFKLDLVVLGKDDDGDDITVAILSDEMPDADNDSSRAKLSKGQRRAMELLERCIIDEGKPAPVSNDYPRGIGNVVTIETWRTCCVKGGLSTGTKDSADKAFRRAMADLIDMHRVGTWDGLIWIAYEPK